MVVMLPAWMVDLVLAASTRTSLENLQLARLHRVVEQLELALAQERCQLQIPFALRQLRRSVANPFRRNDWESSYPLPLSSI